MHKFLSRAGIMDKLEKSRYSSLRQFRTQFAFHNVRDMISLDLPWWNYETISYISDFLSKRDSKVFEFGSGASTVWLSKRSKSVESVEHDEWFFNTVKGITGGIGNIVLNFAPAVLSDSSEAVRSGKAGYENYDFTEYVLQITKSSTNAFDLIVIDGRARMACLKIAMEHLTPGGLILLDNSNRKRYNDSIEAVSLEKLVHKGSTPGSPIPTEAIIFINR